MIFKKSNLSINKFPYANQYGWLKTIKIFLCINTKG